MQYQVMHESSLVSLQSDPVNKLLACNAMGAVSLTHTHTLTETDRQADRERCPHEKMKVI